MASATVSKKFKKISSGIVKPGSYYEANNGVNPLVNVKQETINDVLLAASSELNSGYLWAVLAVLMRMRFGDFVFFAASSPLLEVKEAAMDDVQVSVVGFRKFVLIPYANTVAAFSNLFEKENRNRMHAEIYESFRAVGFYDKAIIKMIAFLRDVQDELPRDIGQEVEVVRVIDLLLPVLVEAFPCTTNAFLTADEMILSKVVDGKVGSDIHISKNSAVKGDVEGTGVVLGQVDNNDEVCFGVMISHFEIRPKALQALQKLQVQQQVKDATEPIQGKETVALKTKMPVPASVGTNQDLLAEVAKRIEELTVRLRQSKAALEVTESAMAEVEAAQAEELKRHQVAVGSLNGQYQDLSADHASAAAQIFEIETSLNKLGITLPS